MPRLDVISVLCAALLTVGWDCMAGEDDAGLPRPIIAELFAKPDAFAGRRVAVYGLVIASSRSGSEFLLLDVSQRPLKVVAPKNVKASVGDQLTAVGTFQSRANASYLAATSLIPTRVTGGGGCC
jgi:hypothetical protein